MARRSRARRSSIERDFIAYEKYNLYPAGEAAHAVAGPRHRRRSGVRPVHGGDAPHDQATRKLRETVNRDATIALLDKIGPAILMPHSQSAAPVWLAADARPQLVKALLMVEAGTSSFYEIKLVGAPDWFKDGELGKPFGVTRAPITYDPPVKGVEDFALVRQEKPDAPTSPAAGSRRSRRTSWSTSRISRPCRCRRKPRSARRRRIATRPS